MNEKKLGGGIITCTIIYIVFTFFGIIGSIFMLFARDFFEESLKQTGQTDALAALTPLNITISVIIAALLIVSLALLLLKKKIGVYSTFALIAVNFIFNIIVSGFAVSLLIGLILPALLGYFVYKKRWVFGFYDPNIYIEEDDEDEQANL